MKYGRATWAIFAAWAARKLHLPKPVVEGLEDTASMRMFTCSLDFEPAEIVMPVGWRCDHMAITSGGGVIRKAPTSGCGCVMQHIWPTTTAVAR